MRRLAGLLALACLAGCAAPAPGPSQKFLVFFTEWSANISDTARETIKAAADAANQKPTVPITVAGFADPTGSAQANIDISRLRQQVVSDQLVADGVDPTRIVHSAHGATDFTLTSQESRRVDIGIGTP
jgi:outer membrane protein OmpA-like peptidoglycan-associated protein